jgi:hypothetical protein
VRAALLPALLLAAPPAIAFSDAPPWEAASDTGCAECHFGTPPTLDSAALSLDGLPADVEAGATYRLTVRLAAPDMTFAGFLLAARQGNAAAGQFTAADDRAVADGALARSTTAGRTPADGASTWTLDWQAPAQVGAPIRFTLWANAANGDDSPLGDRTHRREWSVPAAP